MDALISPYTAMPTGSDALSSYQATRTMRMGPPSVQAFEAAAKDFESVFMAQMLKPMFEGLETDGMFGGGAGEDAMRDLLIQEYGKAMVVGDKSELSTSIMREMIKLQEKATGIKVGE